MSKKQCCVAIRKLFFVAIVLVVLSAAYWMLITTAGPFTVVFVPDTQHYSEVKTKPHYHDTAIFSRQIQYAVDINASYLIHVGDFVQNDFQLYPGGVGDVIPEWEVADAAMQIADNAGLPYGVAIGNHDYIWKNPNPPPPEHYDDPSYFRTYFGPDRFAGKPWVGGFMGSPDGDDMMNSYHFFQGGGQKYMVIFLDISANDEALAWAQAVVDANLNIPTIVTIHQYLSAFSSGPNKRYTVVDYGRTDDEGNVIGNSPEGIWQKFIKVNRQIFMVLCGHSGGNLNAGQQWHQTSTNDAGLPVHEVLANYQGTGNGWLRELRFFPDENKIEVHTYSPWLDQWSTIAEDRFDLPFVYADYAARAK